nr:MAG TPA: hypothetical protein [Microviridae sp.]
MLVFTTRRQTNPIFYPKRIDSLTANTIANALE